jgi:hypothetical protein
MTVEINSLMSLSNELWKRREGKEPLIPDYKNMSRRFLVIQPNSQSLYREQVFFAGFNERD